MGDRDAIIKRLRRVEGQIKGIQRMITEEKSCGEVLIQVAAARAALNSAGGVILENHMKDCLKLYMEGKTEEKTIEQLVETMLQYTKQN